MGIPVRHTKHSAVSCFAALFFIQVFLASTSSAEALQRITLLEVSASRAETEAFAEPFAVAGMRIDSYLASAAAKHFDPSVEEQFEEVPTAILNELAALGARSGAKSAEARVRAVQLAAAAALFSVCDGQYERVFALRSQWSQRGLAIAYLSLRPKERAENQSEFDAFASSGIMENFIDGLIAAGANYANCPLQALLYLDHAAVRTPLALARARLAMTHSGVLLQQAVGRPEVIEAALANRARAVSDLRGALKVFSIPVPTGGISEGAEAYRAEQLEQLAAYDKEFVAVASLSEAPVLGLNPNTAPKVRVPRFYFHVLGHAFSEIADFLTMPNWPSSMSLLEARGLHRAAAAYALADIFDAPQQLSPVNRSALERNGKSPLELVERAYGKTQLRAEMARATQSIRPLAGNARAVGVRVFEHAFLLPSGERKHCAQPTSIRWFSQAEIIQNFRDSHAYRQLMGLTD